MKNNTIQLFLTTIFIISLTSCNSFTEKDKNHRQKIALDIGISSNKMTNTWLKALKGRKSTKMIDSLALQTTSISPSEQEWIDLIQSKTKKWNSYRDSLRVPFKNITLKDTINILLGYRSGDDAFTIKDNTICLDVSALYRSYGKASKPVNSNRIDRIYSHEFTHLLHRKWATQNKIILNTFKDIILWECLLEGFGMYRSMSKKWFPINGNLSPTSEETFKSLYPIFSKNIIEIHSQKSLDISKQSQIQKNLSRGSMKKKWGALPVAVWLAKEANGNDKNLRHWVDKGPKGIILLAKKHLTGESKKNFDFFINSKLNNNNNNNNNK